MRRERRYSDYSDRDPERSRYRAKDYDYDSRRKRNRSRSYPKRRRDSRETNSRRYPDREHHTSKRQRRKRSNSRRHERRRSRRRSETYTNRHSYRRNSLSRRGNRPRGRDRPRGRHRGRDRYYVERSKSRGRSRRRRRRRTRSRRSYGYDYGYRRRGRRRSYSSRGRASSGRSISSRGSTSSSKKDDTVGCYEGRVGDMIGQYEVRRALGKGTFGSVWSCSKRGGDTSTGSFAVKVIRSIKRYTKSARVESKILEHVNRCFDELAALGQVVPRLCIRLYEHFMWKDHYCIVTEVLGISLYDVVKRNHYKGLHLRHVLYILKHLLLALHFLHTVCHTIHTDLKLENILLVDDTQIKQILAKNDKTGRHDQISGDFNQAIRIIDFGGACVIKPDEPLQDAMINTRQYRSPEVTLEVGWSYPSDVWSAGCIAVEILTGDLLFQTHDEMEHMQLITKVLQQEFPSRVISKSPRKRSFFVPGTNRLAWPEKAPDRESLRHVKRASTLTETIDEFAADAKPEVRQGVVSLLQGLLQIDQTKRLTAEAALQHEAFK